MNLSTYKNVNLYPCIIIYFSVLKAPWSLIQGVTCFVSIQFNNHVHVPVLHLLSCVRCWARLHGHVNGLVIVTVVKELGKVAWERQNCRWIFHYNSARAWEDRGPQWIQDRLSSGEKGLSQEGWKADKASWATWGVMPENKVQMAAKKAARVRGSRVGRGVYAFYQSLKQKAGSGDWGVNSW